MEHQYFDDPNANNEVNAMRAAFNTLNEINLWMIAQRLLLAATEAQSVMQERFPEMWKRFNENVMGGEKE